MNYVFLCVGSNKVVSDSFSCFVGSFLIKRKINAFVYGNLKNPVTALNLDNFIDIIKTKHFNDFIFVIDSKITKNNNIKLSFGKGSLIVGGLNLKRKIGDYFLTLDIPIKNLSTLDINLIIKYAIKASKSLYLLSKKLP